MAAEHAAIDMDDVAGLRGAGTQALDDLRVTPGGYETDVLAVGLFRHFEPEVSCQLARLALVKPPEREAKEGKLLARGGEQKIALVALLVGGAVKLPAGRARLAPHIMAGRERRGTEPGGRLQQIVELDLLIAGDARDRRLALKIAVGEFAHHGLGEARLVVEHVV